MNVKRVLAWTLMGFVLLGAGAATAQPYPSRPVRLVIPDAPGSTADVVGRTIGGKLAEFLGQPVTIDNRPGALELTATETIVKVAPDGYTLLLATPSFAINAALQPKLTFDAEKDFTPIARVASFPLVLVAGPSLPIDSVQDLIAIAKANPGRVQYASVGIGANNHMAAEMFKSLATVQLTHVPYKGPGQALADLLAGKVQIMFATWPMVEAQVRTGKLRALAVTGPKRLAAAPAVPTLTEAGVAGFDFVSWYGVLAPGATAKSIIDRVNADLRKTMQSPEVRDRLNATLGADLAVSSPEAFAAQLHDEIAAWAKLVREMNIKPE
jgi:tripartite-type tricarboxylate transporter receptor subunit TctC